MYIQLCEKYGLTLTYVFCQEDKESLRKTLDDRFVLYQYISTTNKFMSITIVFDR